MIPSECFRMCETLERAYSKEQIQGRLWNLTATVNNSVTSQLLEDTIFLIELNRR